MEGQEDAQATRVLLDLSSSQFMSKYFRRVIGQMLYNQETMQAIMKSLSVRQTSFSDLDKRLNHFRLNIFL